MAKVSLYLDNKQDKEGLSKILLQLTDKGQRAAFSTGEKVPANLWDPKKQRSKPQYIHAFDINKELKAKLESAETVIHDLRHNFNFEKAKAKIAAAMKRKATTLPDEILTKLQEFIDQSKTTRAPNTIKKYITLKVALQEFTNETNIPLHFDSIDKEFGEAFLEYLTTEKKLLNNSSEKYLSCLRTFLMWCEDSGIKIDPSYRKFKGNRHKVEVLYLTEDELMKLYKWEFEHEYLRRARDLFCFACWTGLRYSDVANLTKANIKNDALHVKMIKTRDEVVVPLNQYSRAILEKYDYKLPVISNQKANEYLKEACKIAEFNTPEKTVHFRGVERIEDVKPKHELISFHDARRTFIILLLVKGVNQRIVMQMSGHTDYRSFEKYVKIADSVTADEMKRVWG